ncbi:tripartite tricarboxylate transporter permease, partial [Shouchella shacheensis]|uniref:tripartite tricarboxylate transporter permease n=1 Tax=Shouchella shacheensis TaxID=1649580 RepID=UPI000AC70558
LILRSVHLFGDFFSGLLIMGAIFCIFAGKLIRVPTNVLIPIVTVFIILGAFALRNLMFDAMLVFLFGLTAGIYVSISIP